MLQSILFLLIIATVLFLRSKLRETPLARLSPSQQSLIAVGLLLLLLLAFTGKLGLLIPLLGAVTAAFIALISRMLPIITPLLARHLPEWIERIRYRHDAPQSHHEEGKKSSSARSVYLEMTLDHRSGTLDGTIRQGLYEGRKLSTLSMKALIELYTLYAKDDDESAKLLAAFIERTYGQERHHTSDHPQRATLKPDRDEALSILGLEPGASEEEIINAHRRLIQKLHPDRGGSDYLASRINQAKDCLLGSHNHGS